MQVATGNTLDLTRATYIGRASAANTFVGDFSAAAFCNASETDGRMDTWLRAEHNNVW